ncbi:tetratricopeptide repeat protein [Pseudoalteromonas sp. DL2-H2.2]|uniref:tetratricopeptide repeat protein n=1 Tax=Pseudoalteromonas sp. DL2-H2.2 TaxID=2908889 RepID=UPI001F3E06E1|nr:tetratricopeptide repeat protein [Pseudoalteromonas sp. DL2-H2.2]MCF2909407.1 tetratricopeptide repeat protein [Pseudoalteromonas sp. DL2-H2.2]
MQKTWLFLVIGACYSLSSFATYQNLGRSPADILREAEDYIIVEPSHSYRLLRQITSIEALSPSQQVRWHLIKVRSSIATNNLNNIESELEALIQLQEQAYFKKHLASMLSAMGIALRRLGYLAEAKTLYTCALTLKLSDKKRMALLINLAVLSRHMDDYSLARQSYQSARDIALRLHHERALANVNNNLGTLALDEGKIKLAETYYRDALVGYQSSDKRSGNITAGTNLLFVFAIQGHTLNFQRLISPISALVDAYPDKSKKALLLWLVSANDANLGKALPQDTRENLLSAFEQLESEKLQQLVKRYLAPKVKLEVIPAKRPERVKKKLPAWFKARSFCTEPAANLNARQNPASQDTATEQK